MRYLVSLSAFLWAVSGLAMQLHGVEMIDQLQLGEHKLQLNGMGLREATIFNFPVYVSGLYLEKPSHNPSEILKSDQMKRVQLHFVRDVDAKDIRHAWDDAFRKNSGGDLESLRAPLEKLQALVSDMKKGEAIGINIYPERVDISKNARRIGSVEVSRRFGEVLLASWLGPEPPNEELKVGMLGLAK